MTPTPKAIVALTAASVASNATGTAYIDTLGYDYALIAIMSNGLSTQSATLTALTLGDGDTNTAYTNLTGFVGGTDFTLATAAAHTADEVAAVLGVDLRAKRRYLRLGVTPRTAATVSAVALLFRGDEVPVTASKAGVGNLVYG